MPDLVIRFSGDGLGIASKVIQAATWSWCSHVELEAPDNPALVRLLGALPGPGVCFRSMPVEPEPRVERYRVIGGERVQNAVWDAACSQRGAPYDWSGVFGFGLHRDWAEPGSWFCSEFVAWCWEKAGLPLLRADHVSRISPRDLLMSPLLIPVSAVRTHTKSRIASRNPLPSTA